MLPLLIHGGRRRAHKVVVQPPVQGGATAAGWGLEGLGPLAADSVPLVGGTAIHGSHLLVRYPAHDIWACHRCGAFADLRVKNLARPCTRTCTKDGAYVLKCLKRGVRPYVQCLSGVERTRPDGASRPPRQAVLRAAGRLNLEVPGVAAQRAAGPSPEETGSRPRAGQAPSRLEAVMNRIRARVVASCWCQGGGLQLKGAVRATGVWAPGALL